VFKDAQILNDLKLQVKWGQHIASHDRHVRPCSTQLQVTYMCLHPSLHLSTRQRSAKRVVDLSQVSTSC
jgi:hypothetical protein